MASLPSGFASVREYLSYALGSMAVGYGLTFAAPDRALIAVGAGLSLIGAPIVGSIFEKKGPT